MKVALAQISSSKSKEENLKKSLDVARKLESNPPDILIYPEYQMLNPSFDDPEFMIKESELITEDFVNSFVPIARDSRMNILLNVVERNNGHLKPFNTSVMLNDMGMIGGKYRKKHLFDAYSFKESKTFTHGYGALNPFFTEKFSIGVQICYDLRFPEAARLLRLKGANILSYQAGWFKGERKLDTWLTLLRTRAMENGAFVLGVAQTGNQFTGHSVVINPYGDILSEADEEETVITSDLDLTLIEEYLKDVPVLKQRRTDIYDIYDVGKL
ncbi:amidohydrolase [uncultured archaeon]|nr:amidohydrolase [uncultured archaeon]